FNNDLSRLTSATFIGGDNFEESHAITLDSSHNVFIAGYTGSSEYPSTAGVYDATFNGNHDVVITKLSNDLAHILASTFVGGTEDDDCYGLVIEGAENVFITGISFSTDYPTSSNAFDTSHNGERDIFFSRLSFDLRELLESTYLGGADNDWALDLAIDQAGSVFIGGGTYSGDFPIQGSPYDDSHNEREDAIVAKIVGCGVNDFCDPTTAFGSVFLDIAQDSAYTQGCSASASPGPIGEGGCFDFSAATVWYRFTPEISRECIKIAISSEELAQPQLAVFAGDCPTKASSLPFTCAIGAAGELAIHMGVEAELTYYLAVSDAGGAEGYFDLVIEHSPADALALEVTASNLQCFESQDGIIELAVSNGTGFITYDWNVDSLDGHSALRTLPIGQYQVSVSDENNCIAQTDTITLTQPDQIFVDARLAVEDNIILYGDTTVATARPSINEQAIARIIWTPPYVLADNEQNELLTQAVAPLANEWLYVLMEDTTGCIAIDSTLMIVSTQFPFYLPNAFNPRSSHPENARFRPLGTEKIQNVNFLRIFDRWGTLVYEGRDFSIYDQSMGWDGTLNGTLLEPGVYLYILELSFINGAVRQYSGEVTMMR
ncbi:MAG: hypothetical protein D6772_06210, partial [Bacteroidetes bacterium]